MESGDLQPFPKYHYNVITLKPLKRFGILLPKRFGVLMCQRHGVVTFQRGL